MELRVKGECLCKQPACQRDVAVVLCDESGVIPDPCVLGAVDHRSARGVSRDIPATERNRTSGQGVLGKDIIANGEIAFRDRERLGQAQPVLAVELREETVVDSRTAEFCDGIDLGESFERTVLVTERLLRVELVPEEVGLREKIRSTRRGVERIGPTMRGPIEAGEKAVRARVERIDFEGDTGMSTSGGWFSRNKRSERLAGFIQS